MLGGQLSPPHGQGRVILTLALLPPLLALPWACGLLTEPVLLARPVENLLVFCGNKELYWLWWAPEVIQGKQQDHGVRNKMGRRQRWSFFSFEKAWARLTPHCISWLSGWMDGYQILSNYHILLLPLTPTPPTEGGKLFLWSHIIISWCFPFTKLHLHH